MNSIKDAKNMGTIPPIPSSHLINQKIMEDDEKDAPIIARLIAGILPIIGFFMAELVYGRSPKRCKQIWRITLWSFLIQSVIIVVFVVVFIWAFLNAFAGYC